jgi:hypothetical protein
MIGRPFCVSATPGQLSLGCGNATIEATAGYFSLLLLPWSCGGRQFVVGCCCGFEGPFAGPLAALLLLQGTGAAPQAMCSQYDLQVRWDRMS